MLAIAKKIVKFNIIKKKTVLRMFQIILGVFLILSKDKWYTIDCVSIAICHALTL